jgi:hypothetical protein
MANKNLTITKLLHFMGSNLKEVMAGKSDEQLKDYLVRFEKFTPEAITAAADELKKRGKQFTEQELKELQQKVQSRVKAEQEEVGLWDSTSNTAMEVTDPDAPLLYSKRAIRAFSILFSTIFGAVLVASNITDTGRKWTVIGFGIVLTALSIVVANLVDQASAVTLLNIAGGLGLISTFWDRYIGKETKYRAKPIWKPLIISLIIIIPFILAAIYG